MGKDIGKLRGLSPDELRKEENALREEVWKLRLQMAIGQLQNSYQVRTVKRDLARVLTIQREQELAGKPAGAGKKKGQGAD